MSYGYNNFITLPEDENRVINIITSNVTKYLGDTLPSLTDRDTLIHQCVEYVTKVINVINTNLPGKGQFQFAVDWYRPEDHQYDHMKKIGMGVILLNGWLFGCELLRFDGYPRPELKNVMYYL